MEFTDSVTVSFTIICCIVTRNNICYVNICFNNNVISCDYVYCKGLNYSSKQTPPHHVTGSVAGFSTAGFIKSLEL